MDLVMIKIANTVPYITRNTRFVRQLIKMTSSQANDPSKLANPYFSQNSGKKDIWSLINETAVNAEKESGKPVVNLGQGFFSYNPPDFALDSVKAALTKPQFNQYAPARGNPNLLQRLSEHYTKEFKRPVDTQQLQVTTGANEGLFSIFFGFLSPGDEVIVFTPFFDQYIPNVEMTGAKVKYVDIKAPSKLKSSNVTGDDWEVDWEGLHNAISEKTKIIVLNTPHNPIGKVFTNEELIRLGKIVVENNLILASDEVYENLYYTDSFPRPANLPEFPELAERTLTVGSAGKSFSATGWRVGWVQGPANLIKYVTAAHTRICFSTPAPLQQAVADAFVTASKNNYFKQTREDYIKKYKIFTKVFDDLKIPYSISQGSYFLLVNLSKLKIPNDYKFPKDIMERETLDFKLAYFLTKEIGVVGIPPTEFVPLNERKGHLLEGSLRFAVCKDDSVLEDAVKRLNQLENYL